MKGEPVFSESLCAIDNSGYCVRRRDGLSKRVSFGFGNMQPQWVGERQTENRRYNVRFSREADGWCVATKGQRNDEEEKAAEGVGENGGYKKRALHGFAVAETHNKGVVKAATAAVEHESADNCPNSNVSERKAMTTNDQNTQTYQLDQLKVHLHAKRDCKNEQYVQHDERDQQDHQEHLAATASNS